MRCRLGGTAESEFEAEFFGSIALAEWKANQKTVNAPKEIGADRLERISVSLLLTTIPGTAIVDFNLADCFRMIISFGSHKAPFNLQRQFLFLKFLSSKKRSWWSLALGKPYRRMFIGFRSIRMFEY